KLGARRDQLLLSKIIDLDQPRRGELLDRAAWWFDQCLSVILPDSRFGPLLEFLDENLDFRIFAGEFLRHAGTGIKDLHIDQSEISADKIPKEIREGLQPPKDEEASIGI